MEAADRERLFVRQIAALRNFARRIVRDEDSVDDLIQDVALTLLEHPRGPVDAESFPFWCRAVARHLSMHRRRSFARGCALHEAFGVLASGAAAEDVERAVIVRELLAAGMQGLDETSQRLLVQRYVDGETSSEIAARRGVSAASIRMRLARLRSAVLSAADIEKENGDTRDEDRRG